MSGNQTTEEVIKGMQAAMLMFKNETDKLSNNFSQMQNEMQALHKETGKVKMLIEEGTSSSGSSSGGKGAIVDEKDLELKIKKVLFEDEDLGKTFEKIIANTIDFEERKKEVDKVSVDKKLKKITKTKKISKKTILISVIIGLTVVIGGIVLYGIKSANSYILKSGQMIYSYPDGKNQFSIQSDTEIYIVNRDGNKLYFSDNGKKYYFIKK